jgi:hypothetical protein
MSDGLPGSSVLVLPGAGAGAALQLPGAAFPSPAGATLLGFDEREYDVRHFHHSSPPVSPGAPEFVFGRRFHAAGAAPAAGAGAGAATRSGPAPAALSQPAPRGQGWVGSDLGAAEDAAEGGAPGGGGGSGAAAAAAAHAGGGGGGGGADPAADEAAHAGSPASSVGSNGDSEAPAGGGYSLDEGLCTERRRGVVWADEQGRELVQVRWRQPRAKLPTPRKR